MADLSDRQAKILKAVVEEYINSADPVASELIEKKYNLGVSPATIRNEMSDLTDSGFLKQPHTSSGRIPTSTGIKFYIDHLMQAKNLSVVDEVSAKEQVWDSRFNQDKLLQDVARVLAQKTHSLAVAATEDSFYSAGMANILEMPEFYDIDVTRNVLLLIDEYKKLQEMFFRKNYGDESVHIVLGEELNWPYMDPVGFVFADFKAGSVDGTVGIIGACRLNYPSVIPTVRYFSDLISEIGRGW